MTIVLGLDQHRQQITFDSLDTETGELTRGRIRPATRAGVRSWLARFAGKEVEAALEATTGWLFLCEELERAGVRAHLADPAETAARRGRKRRAKTDRVDARHLRELLQSGRLPEAWIPPAHISELRSRVRLRHTLIEQRTAWLLRIHAVLFHYGLPPAPEPLTRSGRPWLERQALPLAAAERVEVALAMVDMIDRQVDPLERALRADARRQPACRALMAEYGIGPLLAPAIVAELGDVRRFGSSRRSVRHSGLDITVHASDERRLAGHLSRQGPPVLRWALYEAAKCAARPGSPDHGYYLSVKHRLGAKRATLAVARRLLRRCYHTLLALEEEALAAAA
jgi:transposase